MPRIVIIAGEASGDLLAAGLIRELRLRYPDAQFAGITGPQMRAEGCTTWGDFEQLAVMGLFEVVRHLPKILRVKRDIQRRLRDEPPDLLIGVDSPDFNLRIERYARSLGIRTVQYVCPSVWAWRSSRVKTIRAACDKVLCLLPFEPGFLREHNVDGVFVGHPLADQLADSADQKAAREALGLGGGPAVALLPGSRQSEIDRLGELFLQAAEWMSGQDQSLHFVVAAANPVVEARVRTLANSISLPGGLSVISGRTRTVIEAADAVLVASGTATLETMLLDRPMVVAYKASPLTAWLLRRSGLVTAEYFSLPNLLAGEGIVPELLQEDATVDALGSAVLRLVTDDQARNQQLERFRELAGRLKCSADTRAAQAVEQLLRANSGKG